jgi:hypothetical protein
MKSEAFANRDSKRDRIRATAALKHAKTIASLSLDGKLVFVFLTISPILSSCSLTSPDV